MSVPDDSLIPNNIMSAFICPTCHSIIHCCEWILITQCVYQCPNSECACDNDTIMKLSYSEDTLRERRVEDFIRRMIDPEYDQFLCLLKKYNFVPLIYTICPLEDCTSSDMSCFAFNESNLTAVACQHDKNLFIMAIYVCDPRYSDPIGIWDGGIIRELTQGEEGLILRRRVIWRQNYPIANKPPLVHSQYVNEQYC